MERQMRAAIEALLFLAAQPLSTEELAQRLDLEERKIEELVAQLRQDYNSRGSGLTIVRVGGGYRLCTRPELVHYLIPSQAEPRGLSAASLEVLAIVAYRQPVTRVQIDQIRGVRSERALANLVERDLVVEGGRLDAPGRPFLYETSDTFLETFGLDKIQDLPPLPFTLPNKQDS
jgi:segregation and condensation protein B